MSSGERVYQLVGGHAALDFVNTLDWRFREGAPEELLASYGDLIAFAEQSELLSARQAKALRRGADGKTAERVLEDARALREALAEILYAQVDEKKPAPTALKTVEEWLKAVRDRQTLQHAQGRMAWALPERSEDAELPVWLLAQNAEELLTSGAMDKVRACAKPDCRWLFLDTSKNHTRRWCDMKLCGNRMKARRFKAQHRIEA